MKRHLLWSLATAVGILALERTVAHVDGRRQDTLFASLGPAMADSPQSARYADDFRDVTITAGTMLALTVDEAVNAPIGPRAAPIRAHVSRAVAIDGVTAIPEGTEVFGARITRGGRAVLRLRLRTAAAGNGNNEEYDIRAARVGPWRGAMFFVRLLDPVTVRVHMLLHRGPRRQSG